MPEGEGKEKPGFEGPKENDPPKWTPPPGLDIAGVWLANDLYTANGIGWVRLGVTKQSSVSCEQKAGR